MDVPQWLAIHGLSLEEPTCLLWPGPNKKDVGRHNGQNGPSHFLSSPDEGFQWGVRKQMDGL